MLESLKDYEPSDRGRELIAILFPLSQKEREENIQEYWKHYPQEINAILDGFHFMIQELIEARNADDHNNQLKLSDDLMSEILQQMKKEKNYFSYSRSQDFLQAVISYQPPIFFDSQRILKTLKMSPAFAAESTTDPKTTSGSVIDDRCRELGKASQDSYELAIKILPSLKKSQIAILVLQKSNDKLSAMDAILAKETLKESQQVYQKHVKIIANGMPYIFKLYQKHPEQIDALQVYAKYLAKVLASREAIGPAEIYLLNLAKGDFDYNIPDFSPTELQLQHNKTSVTLCNDYREKLRLIINRLECRYRKRKLMTQYKQGTSKLEVISELQKIVKIDPDDIRTHILLARFMGEHLGSLRDAHQRKHFRQQTLHYCQTAFSTIDVYLDLQGIKSLKARNLQRVGFIKTISAIRLPLIQTKK